MPPRGTRGRGRGRGRGSTRGGHSGVTDRTSDAATTLDNPSQTQAQDSDGSDLVMQDAATRPIEISATPEVQPEQSTAPSATQSRTPSVAPSRAGGRFRPKNVRRDATERARLEQERSRDLNMKIKEEEREVRAEERRARRGRGRGDMSQRGFARRTITASGPFSAVPQESSGWGPKSDRTGFSSEYTLSRYKPRRENEHRINVDALNGYNEYEDGSIPPGKSRGTMPVGLLRIQHEDEEVKVKTTAELEAEERQSSDDEDLFFPESTEDLQNVGTEKDGEVWHAAPKKGQVKVKTEPGADPDAMDMSDIPEAAEVKEPPAETRRLINEVGATVLKRKRKSKAAKDPEIAQTLYDLRYQFDTLSLHAATGEKEGEDQEAHRRHKDDQIMLFQLPPILPPLAPPTNDADGETDSNGILNTAPKSHGKIKTEDGANKEESGWNPFGTLPPEGGRIGKLIVRKSGKVEFDWGGTTLSVGVGADPEFTTTAVMVEQNVDLQNPELSTGVACGMGQINNKFVLAPIWDEEEDWDPNLEDIGL
ncbi:RNA polymerase III RPC4-domain-containing protein [Annulohypoxylon maeteangense]|uniref:RNA polymerase III RPC4-domain-containing protein n=1 Tax=Annulohypoxylon maeteangense TaxID=1927788 RepID=UPI00200816D1|nr:RNA polymerase III RPC4-domain-containing protein [Annulohypoxylon maeteangense]KAI0884256.1 RNA polymerase III RPC4-domain-containing protein [Annulohypoxylon maeteangense]